jgi:maleylpyruvate isomerase
MPKLYGYWRSSAAYRLRIALALKGIDFETAITDLRQRAHRAADYLARNPQGLVPALEIDGTMLVQSLAIIEYLDETRPRPPLLPRDPAGRARVRALALAVACEIHPLNNLRVLDHLRHGLGLDKAAVDAWYRHWIAEGLAGLEPMVAATAGRFAFGDAPGLADIFIVPQLYNARRFACDLAAYPTLRRVDAACLELDAFRRAAPEAQPDAEPPRQ